MMLSDKAKSVVLRIEVIIAAILFFVMLISCGLYINIKLNGKTSNLPMLSESDKKMLLRANASESPEFSDDLLEPVFIGVRNGLEMKAVKPDDAARKDAEVMILDAVELLFSGNFKKAEFSTEEDFQIYIENKKYSDNYVLVAFYDNLPSSAILPCIDRNYRFENKAEAFSFKYLFILPNKNGNLYGCAISDKNEVVELYPEQEVGFNKIFDDSYDTSEDWVSFEYLDFQPVMPVISSSVSTHGYVVESFAQKYGKDKNTKWIQPLFEVFSINSNLVRDFTSGDGSETNFVEEFSELIIDDNGSVQFYARDMKGILLEEYLGYIADNGSVFSVAEKIYVLKRIISELNLTDNSVSYSMVGMDYEPVDDSLKVYFKYMTDGIFVFNTPYDAFFEISGNMLVSAEFKAISVKKVVDSDKILFPQKYASVSLDIEQTEGGTYFIMSDEDGDGVRNVNFGFLDGSAEVDG